MLKILTVDQKEQWNSIVRSMNQYDFYHLAEYHQLEHSGQPLLLYFSSQKTSITLPVVLRPVAGTEYNDLTSVYGYVGPLPDRENPDEQSIKDFHEALFHFFGLYKIVSVFTRLHPLFGNQALLLSGLGEIVEISRTVAIDLSLPEQEQKRQYAHSIKSDINRLKRRDVYIKKVQSREEINLFIEMYRESMNRVKASNMYFFPDEYFYRFMEKLPSSLFLAYHEKKAISGSLTTACNGIVQHHLSATLNDYLKWSPLKFVWDYIRRDAIEKNEKWMHMGGGFGGADDSLFQFKSFFSDLRFPFKIWQYIHNKDVYNRLTSEKHANRTPDSSFFPLYRIN